MEIEKPTDEIIKTIFRDLNITERKVTVDAASVKRAKEALSRDCSQFT